MIAPVDRVGCPYPRVRATGTTFQHQSHHWVHRASYYLEGAMVQAFVCSNQSPGGSRSWRRVERLAAGDGEEASIAFMEHAQAMYRLQDTPNLFRLYGHTRLQRCACCRRS